MSLRAAAGGGGGAPRVRRATTAAALVRGRGYRAPPRDMGWLFKSNDEKLRDAVREGDEAAVRALLDSGVQVDKKGGDVRARGALPTGPAPLSGAPRNLCGALHLRGPGSPTCVRRLRA